MFLNKFYDRILLFLLVLLSYFQVAFFLHPLKFGAIAYHYPWRYKIVEAIRAGELPFWFWTQHLGQPIHADPQSGAWYPIVWIFSLFGKYTLYSFHTEFILHILIGGFGMQILFKNLNISKFSGLLMSLSYVLSGAFSDNVLTSWTISMAWIPWIFAATLLLVKNRRPVNMAYLALTLTMLITGGYPAFTIVIAYILTIYIGVVIFSEWIKKRVFPIRLTLSAFMVLIITIMTTMVVLVSVYQSTEYIGRTQPLTVDYASDGALNPKSFISLLLPFTTVAVGYGVIPEIDSYFTMANSYFGLIAILLVMVSPVVLAPKKMLPYFLLALVFVFFSMGDSTPVYNVFFHYLPGFNLFRYPNFVRPFFIIPLLILAGLALDKLSNFERFKSIMWIVFGLIVLFFSISLFTIFRFQPQFDFSSIYLFFRNMKFGEAILMQSIFQIILLIAFLGILMIKKSLFFKSRVIGSIIIIDLIISFQLNFMYTGYAQRISVKDAQNVINQVEKPIGLTQNKNVFENRFFDRDYYFDYGLNDYSGKVSYFGNISFKTNPFAKLLDNDYERFRAVTSNSLIHFSANILSERDNIGDSFANHPNSLILSSIDYHKYASLRKTDTLLFRLKLLESRPNSIECEIEAEETGFVTLLQNNYPGWKVLLNGKESELIVSNTTFLSVFAPKGKNRIKFYYSNSLVKTALISSLTTFLLLFVFISYTAFKVKRK